MSYSKYRNVYGELKKEKFSDMDKTQSSSEGHLMAVNGTFLAISWNSTGGGVAIFNSNTPCRCSANIPLVRGHKSYVVDVKFSPFRSDLLITASDDSTVKLWEIPQDGLKEDLNVDLQHYNGHARKVAFVNFNPVCSDVIASASFDNTIQVWNMLKSELICKSSLKEYPTSMEWNYNGSLIGCSSKDKHIYVVDPRNGDVTVKTKGHDSPKTMKMTWVSEYNIISTGFSKSNTREMKLWDIRKVKNDLSLESPVQSFTIDHQSGIPTPYFDEDLKILYIFGRGEGNMHYYDLNDSKIKQCNDFLTSDPTEAIVMFEKKTMNYNKCEIARFAKYTKNNIVQYLSFYYPKRNPEFEESLYPPTFCGESAMNLEEWISGNNKDPVKKDIRDIENKWVTESQTFTKKVEEPKPISNNVSNAQLEKKISELTSKVNELENENKTLKAELEKLKSEME
jgi:WD40 repeat protein